MYTPVFAEAIRRNMEIPEIECGCQMTYDRMLEQEQVTYGWEDVQQRV